MKNGLRCRRANRERKLCKSHTQSMMHGEMVDVQLDMHPGRASARFFQFHRDQMLQRPAVPVRLICAFPETDENTWTRQPADDDQSCENSVKHGFRMAGITVGVTVLKSNRRRGRRAIVFGISNPQPMRSLF